MNGLNGYYAREFSFHSIREVLVRGTLAMLDGSGFMSRIQTGNPTVTQITAIGAGGPGAAILQTHSWCGKRLVSGLLHLIQDRHCCDCDHDGSSAAEQKSLHRKLHHLHAAHILRRGLLEATVTNDLKFALYLPALGALKSRIE